MTGEWIKELEESAKKNKHNYIEGDIDGIDQFLYYEVGDTQITLDGYFTAEHLEALAKHMKKYQK